jgi:hypothetical protein
MFSGYFSRGAGFGRLIDIFCVDRRKAAAPLLLPSPFGRRVGDEGGLSPQCALLPSGEGLEMRKV